MRNIILIPIVLYLALVFFVWINQRRLIYHPSGSGKNTPKDFGTPYKDLTLKSADGTEIHAWWIEHSDKKPERPTLLYCHGNGGTLSELSEVSSIFYNLGWNVLLFDYRQYGKSGDGPLTQKGVVADARAAYDWIIKEGVPPTKILLWGHSLGSAVAAQLSKDVPIAGLILEGAFPSMYEIARKRYPWLAMFPFMIWDTFETGEAVKSHTFPLLVMHGALDTIIPLSLGERVFAIAGEPKEWLLVPDIGHVEFPSVHSRYDEQLKSFAQKAIQ